MFSYDCFQYTPHVCMYVHDIYLKLAIFLCVLMEVQVSFEVDV